jgi:hypothetical protein
MAHPTREMNGCLMTGAVQALPLEPSMRTEAGRIIVAACANTPNILYGILLCGSSLVTLIQPREARLHLQASDLLLVINVITTQASFKMAESWTPICLPRFNDSGFLYAYVSYLPLAAQPTPEGQAGGAPSGAREKSREKDVCLLLVSTDNTPEQFKASSLCCAEIDAKLREKDFHRAVRESVTEHRMKAMTR